MEPRGGAEPNFNTLGWLYKLDEISSNKKRSLNPIAGINLIVLALL